MAKRDRDPSEIGIGIATADEIQVFDDGPPRAEGEEGASPSEESSSSGAPARSRQVRPKPGARLFVGGLTDEVETADLRRLFEPYGEVIDCVVMKDRDTGFSRGFGFVTMSRPREADAAREALGGSDHEGQRLRVDVAAERR